MSRAPIGITRSPGAVLLLALIVSCRGLTAASEDGGALRLIGEADGRVITEVANDGGLLVERTASGSTGLPRAMRWRLEGDLREHAEFIDLAPPHHISTCRIRPLDLSRKTASVATMFVARHGPWTSRDLQNAVAVFAWVIDGRACEVVPVPTTRPGGASTHWAALAALELDPHGGCGLPIVLVRRDGTWVSPKPRFDREPVNVALRELTLGSQEGFEHALGQLESGNKHFRRDWRDLVELAAARGAVPALRALLDLKMSLRRDPGPLCEAAAYGRDNVIPILIDAGAAPEAEDRADWTAADHAIARGHLSTALLLPGKRSPGDLGTLLELSLAHGNRAAVETLLAHPRTPSVRSIGPATWTSAVLSCDPAVVALMLSHGMRADVRADGSPLLVTAAACGDADVVRLLLKAGAAVDRAEDKCRITPLMAAAMHVQPTVAELLLEAGASVDRTDRWGNTALDYARACGRAAVEHVLLAHGATSAAGKELPPEAVKFRRWFAALIDTDAAVRPVHEVDLPPRATHAPPIEVNAAETSRVETMAVHSRVPVAQPLERGSPIVMTDQVHVVPTGMSAPARADQWALVSLVVETDGTPSCVTWVDGSRGTLRSAVVDKVEQYRFLPGELGGGPVRTHLFLPVTAKP